MVRNVAKNLLLLGMGSPALACGQRRTSVSQCLPVTATNSLWPIGYFSQERYNLRSTSTAIIRCLERENRNLGTCWYRILCTLLEVLTGHRTRSEQQRKPHMHRVPYTAHPSVS
ncbi:hypothetical protein HD554DRAFT_2100481, partial [Boletus coccyginus]